MLPLVLATLTVVAITMSTQASYSQMAQLAEINRTPSAEVLKLHASNHATMEDALNHPDFPPFIVESAPDGFPFVVEPPIKDRG